MHVVRHASALTGLGAQVHLVEPGSFWYSGMATGMLAGMYEPEEDRIDPLPLARRCGVRLVQGRAVGLDRTRRQLRVDSGEDLAYEALSFNIGSEVDQEAIPGAAEGAWPVKPIAGLRLLRERLEEAFRRGPAVTRIVVVGGGPTGCEVASSAADLARRREAPARVTLLSASPRLLDGHPRGASRSVERALHRREVDLSLSCRVERITPGLVHTENGREFPADAIVLATGLRPPRALTDFGLPLDRHGALTVDATLSCPDDRRVFGAGDCVGIEGHDLPRLGVFGVREGPILLANLAARLQGRSLVPYRPQRRWLLILNLGWGEGLAIRGRFWWRGRLSLILKDRIDRRFLAKHRAGARS